MQLKLFHIFLDNCEAVDGSKPEQLGHENIATVYVQIFIIEHI